MRRYVIVFRKPALDHAVTWGTAFSQEDALVAKIGNKKISLFRTSTKYWVFSMRKN